MRRIRAASDIPRTVGATLKTLAVGLEGVFCDRGDLGDLDLLRDDDDDDFRSFAFLLFLLVLLLLPDMAGMNEA